MSMFGLKRRIDRVLAYLDSAKNRILKLPMRVIHIDEDGQAHVVYEAPIDNPEIQRRNIEYKEYVNFNPDEDGVDCCVAG